MPRNCQRAGLISRRVRFNEVLESVVIDIVCGNTISPLRHRFQVYPKTLENQTYNAPIVARIPPGKSVRTSSLTLRMQLIEVMGNTKKAFEVVSFFVRRGRVAAVFEEVLFRRLEKLQKLYVTI